MLPSEWGNAMQGSFRSWWVALAVTVSAVQLGSATDKTTAVLWRDPGAVATKDLYWGQGSPDRAPAPPFTFVKEDRSGTKPKVQVTDANGVLWAAKFPSDSRSGIEVHAEIAASRLLWALGYVVEEHYFVGNAAIVGVKEGVRRRTARLFGPDGSFPAARFERRVPDSPKSRRWDLDHNPFAGSPELSGLKVLALLMNNWDARPGNTSILRVPTAEGVEERYLLSDVGTAFGRMPGPAGWPTRWNLMHYQGSDFVRAVVNDTVTFCHGLDKSPPLVVPLEHARWLLALTSQLTDAQVRRAFEASGASAQEVDGFSTHFMERLDQLRSATDASTQSKGVGCS